MDDFADILGGGAEQPQAPGTGFGGMMQPQSVDPSTFMRPVASPQETEQRRGMWQQIVDKFQTDPNLQRALFMTGAMMAQPIQPGQTSGGALANAGVVGLNAYTSGTEADEKKAAGVRKEGREERQLGVQEAAGAAQVAASGASTKKSLLDIKRAEGTLDKDVEAGNALSQEKIDKAKEFRDGASLRTAQRAIDEQKARIGLLTDEEAKRRANLEVEKLEAQIKLIGAQATAAGRSETDKTAVGAGFGIAKQIWEGSPDLQKQYPQMADYQNDFLTGKKKGSATESYAKMLQITGGDTKMLPPEDQAVIKKLREAALAEITGTPSGEGQSGTPAPSPRAVDFLKKNPSTRPQFETLYGAGSADTHLPKATEKPAAAVEKPATPAAEEPSTRANRGAGIRRYGPLTPSATISKGYFEGDAGAANYVNERLKGTFAINLPKEVVADLAKKGDARAKEILKAIEERERSGQ